MKEFRIISALTTAILQEKMNEAGKDGFDLVPHKKVMSGMNCDEDSEDYGESLFIVFMERKILEQSQSQISGLVEK